MQYILLACPGAMDATIFFSALFLLILMGKTCSCSWRLREVGYQAIGNDIDQTVSPGLLLNHELPHNDNKEYYRD
jgi:hypothetical protein